MVHDEKYVPVFSTGHAPASRCTHVSCVQSLFASLLRLLTKGRHPSAMKVLK